MKRILTEREKTILHREASYLESRKIEAEVELEKLKRSMEVWITRLIHWTEELSNIKDKMRENTNEETQETPGPDTIQGGPVSRT
jgi:predicted ATPase